MCNVEEKISKVIIKYGMIRQVKSHAPKLGLAQKLNQM